MGIWLRDPPFAPSIAFGRHDLQNHDFWPKSLPEKAASGTGKQHGLASSMTPFFDLRWSDLQCQTSRPEPIKKEDFLQLWGSICHLQLASNYTVGTFRCVWASRRWPGELKDTVFWPVLGWSSVSNVASRTYKKREFFAAVGLNLHLQLASNYTVGTFRCVWASRRAKPRLLTQKPSQKGCLRNRETAWPGELKDTVFWPVLEWSSVSNVASRTYKKWGFGFEIHRLHLQLRLGVTTGKNTTSDPKAFPKTLASKQRNSMAWRAQGHRFLTCVGVIFSVKRCVQNL